MKRADNEIINNDINYYIIEELEESIAQSILINKKVDIPNDFKVSTTLTEDEIRNKFKKEEDFLKTSLATRSEDFKTVENIEEEKKRKLFKSIVDPIEGLIVNDQITLDDSNLAYNNTDRSISLPDNMKAIVYDIVKMAIETINEEIPGPMLENKNLK